STENSETIAFANSGDSHLTACRSSQNVASIQVIVNAVSNHDSSVLGYVVPPDRPPQTTLRSFFVSGYTRCGMSCFCPTIVSILPSAGLDVWPLLRLRSLSQAVAVAHRSSRR